MPTCTLNGLYSSISPQRPVFTNPVLYHPPPISLRFQHQISHIGQHLKKSSLSESSSDMMDLEDGVDSQPGLLGGSQVRLAPFLGAHHQLSGTIAEKQSLMQNCTTKQQTMSTTTTTMAGGGQASAAATMLLQQRHNSALAVSIETDV